MVDFSLPDVSTEFKGQSVVVTGAAQGLGLQIAASFAVRGADVLVADLAEDKLAAAVAELRPAASGQIEAVAADVSDAASVDAMVAKAIELFGKIDHLVNNAGTLHINPIVDTTPQAFKRVIDVNIGGVFLGMQAVIPHMQAAGRGSIVNLASLASKKGLVNLSAYCASKAAVLSLTQTAALEVAPTIRVNAVCPGVVNTPMQEAEYVAIAAITGQSAEEIRAEWIAGLPMGDFQQPIDVAEAVCFLASQRAGQITGEAIAVNGGLLMD